MTELLGMCSNRLCACLYPEGKHCGLSCSYTLRVREPKPSWID